MTQKPSRSEIKTQNYQLTKMVMFSRHNVRSPFSNELPLEDLTPHTWFKWTSGGAELSMRGGDLEFQMGQYFRKYFEKEGLLNVNEQLDEDRVRVYANSLQRTIATAKILSTGLFPVSNIPVEHHCRLGESEAVFDLKIPFMSDALRAQVEKEVLAMGGSKGLAGLKDELNASYRVIEKVLDFKDSKYAQQQGITQFPDDIAFDLQEGHWPKAVGTLNVSLNTSDALILQYFEEADALKASFGTELTYEEWEQVARVKDLYCDILFNPKSLAQLVAHPLLKVINEELRTEERDFSLIVGHDVNIGSMLSALEVEAYALPLSLEKTTPIGSKLLIEKWEDQAGKAYASFKLVYFSLDQLRNLQVLDLDNPPMVYDLSFKGLTKNEDGLYAFEDVLERYADTLHAFDVLQRVYAK